MFKAFVIGVLIGVIGLTGSVFFYFASGMAPVAVADPMMPYEKKMASRALDARIEKANIPAPPVAVNEENLLAGAKLYKENCSVCHGTPNEPSPFIASNMFPHATLMFKGKGVTDDPPQESYWKIVNGIRLTGMPSFKATLNDTQMWQIAQFVANTDKISDAVKNVLAPEPPLAATTNPNAAPAKAAGSKK